MAEKKLKAAQYAEAEDWCRKHNKGAAKCLAANPHLDSRMRRRGLVKKSTLEDRLKGRVMTGHEYASRTILTELEESELVQWLVACNLGRAGKTMADIGHKVREILLVRHARNHLGGRASIPFTAEAKKILTGMGFPSQSWFSRFFAAHGNLIERKVAQKVDGKRAAAANEETVDEHFNGVWGLRAELIDAGIMDPSTFEITDPRRVLNLDECPQFIDYNDNKATRRLRLQQERMTPRSKPVLRIASVLPWT